MSPSNCAHPAGSWTAGPGTATCRSCGVRRFSDYAALRWPGDAGHSTVLAPCRKPTTSATGTLLLRP